MQILRQSNYGISKRRAAPYAKVSLLIIAICTMIAIPMFVNLLGTGKQERQNSKVFADSRLKTPSNDRLFLVKPEGYVHTGVYSVPGYYTLMLFSAAWCAPCTELRQQAPGWLDKYPNLVIVELDISGRGEALRNVESAILADLDYRVALPAAILLNPFGVYINSHEGSGVAPPVSGYDAIVQRMDTLFPKRKHQQVMPMESQAAMERLRSLHNMRKHYALYSRDENQEQMPY
jgi:thiol-disulfide isomerase/thioredoxin